MSKIRNLKNTFITVLNSIIRLRTINSFDKFEKRFVEIWKPTNNIIDTNILRILVFASFVKRLRKANMMLTFMQEQNIEVNLILILEFIKVSRMEI